MTPPVRATLTIRLRTDLKERAMKASEAHPYRPSLTAIVERGLELALAELERPA